LVITSHIGGRRFRPNESVVLAGLNLKTQTPGWCLDLELQIPPVELPAALEIIDSDHRSIWKLLSMIVPPLEDQFLDRGAR